MDSTFGAHTQQDDRRWEIFARKLTTVIHNEKDLSRSDDRCLSFDDSLCVAGPTLDLVVTTDEFNRRHFMSLAVCNQSS